MAYQSQSNGYMAWKKQSALGTAASGGSGTIFRQSGGPGLRLTKAATESDEVRRDGQRSRGRHGIQKTAGNWTAQVELGSHENIAEAILRDTWEVSDLVVTQATAGLTSITTQAGPPSTITAAAGSWITALLKVGDVVRLTNHSTAANNNRNLRIIGLTATVMTVAETLTTDAAADTTFTVTRPRKLIQNSASSTLIKRYYTIEDVDIDITKSELVQDFVFSSIRFGMQPNGIVTGDLGGMGTGQIALQAGPVLTSPGESTALPLAVVDATIRASSYSGGVMSTSAVDFVQLTSLDLTIDAGAASADVFGSGSIKYSPDVFTGQLAISANFGMLRQDTQMITDLSAETQYSLWLLLVELESEPKDFISIFVPNITLGGVDKSALNKAGGPRTQTIAVPQALIGKDPLGAAATNSDATMIKIQSTAGTNIVAQ